MRNRPLYRAVKAFAVIATGLSLDCAPRPGIAGDRTATQPAGFTRAAALDRAFRRGFIDRCGRVVVPPRYEGAFAFHEGVACVSVRAAHGYAGLSGYIDRSGNVTILLMFPDAGSFYDGLAPFWSSGRSGFMNRDGVELFRLPPGRDAGRFSEGLASFVQSNGETKSAGFIDTSGRVVVEPRFDLALEFAGGFALVRQSVGGVQRVGFIDHAGHLAIPAMFVDALPFSEGLASVRFNARADSWGAVNAEGREVIPPHFVSLGAFHEGRAIARDRVDDDKRWLIIDAEGKFLATLSCKSVRDFHDGRAVVEDPAGEHGFRIIDQAGRFIGAKYEFIEDFSEGLAAFETGADTWTSLFGYIDTSGGVAIPARFVTAAPFSEGLAAVGLYREGSGGIRDATAP